MSVPAKLAPYLSESDLAAMTRAVGDAAARTAADLRVHIASSLLPLEKPRGRAIREYFRLGLDKTPEGTGLLLFFALRKHRFEIVAGPGIDGVSPGTWDRIARDIETRIKEDGVSKGICHGVRLIGELLATPTGPQPGHQGELGDVVSFDEPPAPAPKS